MQIYNKLVYHWWVELTIIYNYAFSMMAIFQLNKLTSLALHITNMTWVFIKALKFYFMSTLLIHKAFYQYSGQRVWGIFFAPGGGETSDIAVCTTMAGCVGVGACSSRLSPGAKLAIAAKRSWFTMGSPSSRGSQPTGGLDGGEIKNCLTGAGGLRFLNEIGVTGWAK